MMGLALAILLVAAAPAAAADDCVARLVAAWRTVEPFVPASAIPPPPRAVEMPPAQCDRDCKDEYRTAVMQRLRAQDEQLQKARQQMAEAIKECGS